MATCCFRSALAFRLQSFWETRAAAGRGSYLLKVLRYLDRFLMSELQPGDTITREVTERYFKSTENLAPGTRINRMSVLRQFCLYQSHFDPRTCLVHRMFLPRRNRPMPHIYTGHEVRRIMAAAPTFVHSADPLLFRVALFQAVLVMINPADSALVPAGRRGA